MEHPHKDVFRHQAHSNYAMYANRKVGKSGREVTSVLRGHKSTK